MLGELLSESFAEMQNCQVELVPGSGIFVSGLFYAGCHQEPTVEGSQLLRKLVREVFTDEEILTGGTCVGRKQRWSKMPKVLNCQKVDAVRGISSCQCDVNFRFSIVHREHLLL